MKRMSQKDRLRVYNKYNCRCAYCGCLLQTTNFQVDHIQPKTRQGNNILENYNPSCRSCNATKATYTIEEFRQRLIDDVDRLRRDSAKFRILERFKIVQQKKFRVVFHFEYYKKG